VRRKVEGKRHQLRRGRREIGWLSGVASAIVRLFLKFTYFSDIFA
jgi:hypothetical protein